MLFIFACYDNFVLSPYFVCERNLYNPHHSYCPVHIKFNFVVYLWHTFTESHVNVCDYEAPYIKSENEERPFASHGGCCFSDQEKKLLVVCVLFELGIDPELVSH